MTREVAEIPQINMTKKSKLAVGILIPIFILTVVFYFVLCSLYTPAPEPLIYPEGNLSASLFVSQNNEYIENESLTESHSFTTVPYVIDVPLAKGATVGSGTIYQAGENFYIYLAEYTADENVQDIIASQFPKAVMIDYIDRLSSYNCMVSEFGYINGFAANYIVDQLFVSNGRDKAMSCIVGYALECSEGYEGKNLFVAVGTILQTSDAFASCKEMLDIEMKTLRFDSALEYELDRIERQRQAQEQTIEEEQEEQDISEEVAVSDMNGGDEEESNITQLPVRISDASPLADIAVTWSNPTDYAVLELFTPDGSAYCEPVYQDEYSASFTLQDVKPGTYMLHIKDYLDCGTISINVNGSYPSGAAPSDGVSGADGEFQEFEMYE